MLTRFRKFGRVRLRTFVQEWIWNQDLRSDSNCLYFNFNMIVISYIGSFSSQEQESRLIEVHSDKVI